MNQVGIGSDNGSSPIRRQAIIWTNVGLLSIGPLGTNSERQNFLFMKMHLKSIISETAAILSRGRWVKSPWVAMPRELLSDICYTFFQRIQLVVDSQENLKTWIDFFILRVLMVDSSPSCHYQPKLLLKFFRSVCSFRIITRIVGYYSYVTWALNRLKSQTNRLSDHQFVQANTNEHIKVSYYWPFVWTIQSWLGYSCTLGHWCGN